MGGRRLHAVRGAEAPERAVRSLDRSLHADLGLSLCLQSRALLREDLRLLVIDLGLKVRDRVARPARTAEVKPTADEEEEDFAAETSEAEFAGLPSGSGVRLDVDRVTKAGALVSGTVRFSDGVSASWALDQFGRLLLQASRPGYQPSRQDMASFQQELRAALERRGY